MPILHENQTRFLAISINSQTYIYILYWNKCCLFSLNEREKLWHLTIVFALAAKCGCETTRLTLLRFALSHRPNLNYLQFYGRRNVIIMRAKDHIAVGSRGWWRSYLPPDLHSPTTSSSLTLTCVSALLSHSFLLLFPSHPLSLSVSLFSTTLLRTGGALAVSISSEAPSSSTDHLTHKWGIISSCNRVWTKKHYN